MSESPFRLNRYDVAQALADLNPSEARISDDKGVLSVPIGGNETETIEIYFPAPIGSVDLSWIERARGVLLHLSEMDNLVQVSCAEECAKSGLHSDNYELYLAYIDLGLDTASLGYFGTKVNTSWDAKFANKNGTWVNANF